MRNSFYDNYIGKNKNLESKTFDQERQDLEKKSVEFEMKRKAQAGAFPDASVSTESHPGTMTENTDKETIIEKASKHLKAELAELVGRGGLTIDVDEYRCTKAHKDKVDASHITDTAYVSFDVNFTISGEKSKLARFAVSFDGNRDKPYHVESKFLDAHDKSYDLNSNVLNAFLMEKEMKTAKAEKPVAWFNPESETFETVTASVNTETILKRLIGEGFEIDSNFYVDACYGPKNWGRTAHMVAVPMNRVAEFTKICGLSDEEWINRGLEKSYKSPETEWIDRALEKTGDSNGLSTPGMDYNKPNYKNSDDWVNRTENKDSKENPYGKGAGMMKDDALRPDLRKEAIKNATDPKPVVASKVPETQTILEQLSKLDELLK